MADWLTAPPLVPVLAATYVLLALERGLELVLNRRNTRLLAARGAVWTDKDGFGLILLAQAALFVAWPLEARLAPWGTTGWWTWPLLGVALLAQALRYWVITTLGERWVVRVATIPGAPRIERGPYRYLRHPNYAAVAIEPLVLPLAFGAVGTVLLVWPLQLLALLRRIRIEERALHEAARVPPGPEPVRPGGSGDASAR